jgi:hypothetical protein
MAEESLLHVDTDWKKQAQEEKRKLAEAAKEKSSPTPAAPLGGGSAAAPATGQPVVPRRSGRALPAPGFGSLVQSIMTQILFYLGELPSSGGTAGMDLDLAKHHLDVLTILEEKTRGNLTPEEQTMLDAALYETRTRFVNVASQLLGP